MGWDPSQRLTIIRLYCTKTVFRWTHFIVCYFHTRGGWPGVSQSVGHVLNFKRRLTSKLEIVEKRNMRGQFEAWRNVWKVLNLGFRFRCFVTSTDNFFKYMNLPVPAEPTVKESRRYGVWSDLSRRRRLGRANICPPTGPCTRRLTSFRLERNWSDGIWCMYLHIGAGNWTSPGDHDGCWISVDRAFFPAGYCHGWQMGLEMCVVTCVIQGCRTSGARPQK